MSITFSYLEAQTEIHDIHLKSQQKWIMRKEGSQPEQSFRAAEMT